MASSSTSSIHKSFKYDVFLSFRGEDTRTTFIDHLYSALQHKSIYTYKDDERIKKGKRISDELIGSIEDSKFYIIVFSKNYASSSWCLDELVKIMECHKTNEHTAYPVFYDVEPSEVRKQTGAVKEAFAKHEKEEAAGKWREAMKEAADLAGWELKNTADRHEAKFIQKIVEEISLELRTINFSADEKLIGMKTRIMNVVSSLELGISDVRMLGIKGMGGSGKTTLARAVFDQISFQFESKSFVENVREVSNASLSGLKLLQNQVLSDVLNNRHITVNGVYDGKNMMKRMMGGRKVLLVLDDVDHIDQLEALAGEPSWFKTGSRIIITTRDEQVLIAHRVKLIRYVNLLSDKEAICLFSRHAFGRELPIQEYEELSRQVLRYASGLPLTIKVLGSFLCGKVELEWTDAIERLKTIPLTETLKKLELSFIGLEEDYKEMFLDVACMLRHKSKDNVIQVLESCGFHARNGLKVLEQKSLITISHATYQSVNMHDHIEEMARNIVRRSHPDKPYKHSRLWVDEEIEDILAKDLGTEATRCIQLNTEKLNAECVMKGLKKMKELRFLDVFVSDESKSDCFCWNSKFMKLPNALRYVEWYGYPFRSLPKTFEANNLVSLKLPHSDIVQLWEGGERKVLNKLRFLDLTFSNLKALDLTLAPNLEKLSLGDCYKLVTVHMPGKCLNLETFTIGGCDDLVELHMPVEFLKLRSFYLSCPKLRKLDLGSAPNLKQLCLRECRDLVELHMDGRYRNLTSIDLNCPKLKSLDLGLTPNLEKLNLRGCYNLVELNAPIGCLKNVVYLDLSNSSRFDSFLFYLKDTLHVVGPSTELSLVAESLESCPFHPDNNLPKFRFKCFYNQDLLALNRNLEMLISFGLCACTNFKKFSRSIGGLQCLRKLKLQGSFTKAPEDLHQLECLEKLSLLSTKIEDLPNSICMMKQLKYLKIESCWLLTKLPEDLGQVKCLEKLTLSSTNIKHLPDSICMLKHLESLELINCRLLEKLPEDIGELECLKALILSSTKVKLLPDSICMLKHLQFLKLNHCSWLEKLPENLGRLECLKMLHLSNTKIKHLLDSICMLKHLTYFELFNCLLLETLPEDLGRLECLKELIITSCKSLRGIPNSVCEMKCLKYFRLAHCIGVEKLPEELGRLESLEKLDIEGTNIDLPQSILLSESVRIYGSSQSFGLKWDRYLYLIRRPKSPETPLRTIEAVRSSDDPEAIAHKVIFQLHFENHSVYIIPFNHV